ncbi:MAG TPA: glycosyltransferase family protein [Rhodothermales bacterium]
MARIVYALSGQGRGHASRVLAITDALRRRGHDVVFCCGGMAREIMESVGEHVIPVPALRQVIEDNEVRLFRTIRCNLGSILRLRQIVRRLADEFRRLGPDLLITDFEAFAPRAARQLGIPILSFNHQEVVTELVYDLPDRHRRNAALTSYAIRLIVPRNPTHILLTSFFFGPLRRPESTTLIPPIIRPEVQALTPTPGEHVLVYFNQTEGAEGVIESLSAVDASFILYNFEPPDDPERYPNLTFKSPSIDEFVDDLAGCRAVICTAGFTLISESLYLGKPLLVVPNRGIFEQTINALFLQRDGLGAAVIERPLTAFDVQQFISNIELYRARMAGRDVLGNDQAVQCIEQLLARKTPSRNGLQEQPSEAVRPGLAAGSYVAKAE